ncbi:hypothetical protein [Paracoccus sp. (in: a-proteobacteria)]|uniref:hypothetical protein n=1 Tax=Paracoccus sp. TaxID=267 RepID=UPI0030039067
MFFDIRTVLVDAALPKRIVQEADRLDALGEEVRQTAIEAIREEVALSIDKPAIFLACAQGSGTHILKLLNSSIAGGNNVLRLASAGKNHRARYLPSINAAITPYAKIIHRPIAIEGRSGRKSLVDHIIEPDDLSPVIFDSFARAFSAESLELIRKEILGPRDQVTALHGENFPIVYGPSPDGGDIQITPVSPLNSLNEFRIAALPAKGSGERVSLTTQELSAKPQNISSAISGRRYRFFASFPRAMSDTDAGLRRLLAGGRFPAMRMDQDLQDMLSHYAKLNRQVSSEDEYSNRAIRTGMARLGTYIVDLLAVHIAEIGEAAKEQDETFNMPNFDPVNLLLGGFWKERDERTRVRSALSAPAFRKLLAERDL